MLININWSTTAVSDKAAHENRSLFLRPFRGIFVGHLNIKYMTEESLNSFDGLHLALPNFSFSTASRYDPWFLINSDVKKMYKFSPSI